MRTDSSKNDVLKKYLRVLCKCYSVGRFERLFPLLSEECVFESQWVLTPNEGKDAVVEYFTNKGTALQRSNSCPECIIVELVGNLNPIEDAELYVNGSVTQRGSFGLFYPDGKLAMLMSQQQKGGMFSVLVDLQLDEQDMISRIDLCMPELFRYKYFDGPFEVEGLRY